MLREEEHGCGEEVEDGGSLMQLTILFLFLLFFPFWGGS